ncbi:GGDEF domain-containing protein [Azospirillum agricola]|uniref:GGDEF domain-containing protein n=1 Tax=Azospirillum agricola TaxID=1720247 RepID=UPI000A0F08E1|nr:GGDEF domain-containing protein [Azospirillum agricola]SMH44943.1 diguanylate cyclase (GGDEF) domain-containing protein [Azospirillum lipoferum]
MNLDTAFIAQMTTIIAFAVGVSVLLASMKYPSYIRRSLLSFAYGKFLVGAGFLVASMRGGMMPELLAALANGLAIAGLSLNYVCARQVQEKSVPRHFALVCGSVVGVGAFLLLLGGPSDLSRVRLLSSVAATLLLLLIAAELLLFYRGRGAAHYLSGGVTLVVAGAFIARIGAALAQPAVPLDRMVNDGTERLVFILAFLSTAAGAINFVLLASDEFNKELTKLAHTDGLTGVLNRRRFFEVAETEFQRSRRHDRPMTLLIIDIDRFKTINDHAGHPFGDRVIQAVADCCARQLRPGDAIGRLGGEEFAILLPDAGPDTGWDIAERLRAAIEREVTPLGAELGLRITGSVGGVAMNASHGGFSDLFAQSDAALYMAKNDGRNRVRFAGSVGPVPVTA